MTRPELIEKAEVCGFLLDREKEPKTSECDGCGQQAPQDELTDLGGKLFCAECMSEIEEDAAAVAQEEAEYTEAA